MNDVICVGYCMELKLLLLIQDADDRGNRMNRVHFFESTRIAEQKRFIGTLVVYTSTSW